MEDEGSVLVWRVEGFCLDESESGRLEEQSRGEVETLTVDPFQKRTTLMAPIQDVKEHVQALQTAVREQDEAVRPSLILGSLHAWMADAQPYPFPPV